MKRSKFSDGVVKIDGRHFQKAYIKTTSEFYVDCPYCGRTIDLGECSTRLICPGCQKEFYAEYCSAKII